MARLSYQERNGMSKKSFAIPKEKTKENPAGRGGYPIPDVAHARNALARVAQHGNPAEQAAVKAKVHARFPAVGRGKGQREDGAGTRNPFGGR